LYNATIAAQIIFTLKRPHNHRVMWSRAFDSPELRVLLALDLTLCNLSDFSSRFPKANLMALLHIPLNQIDEARLVALIAAGAAEGRTIDYKRTTYGGAHADYSEFWPTSRPSQIHRAAT
jgi:hypothetical protein